MAGGDANLINTPYPDGLHLLTFGPFDILDAAQTNEIVDMMTAQFAFTPVKAELTALDIAGTGILFALEDDTGTPQVIIDDHEPTAITLGAGLLEFPTVDTTLVINAGAILTLHYTSGSGDTGLSVKLRLWVKPKF